MKIQTIDTGLFKLDGGAMFGVVPRSMWSRLNPPDSNNMCTWAMRCLLIEDGDRLILIDTGMGDKQDEKFRSHFYPHGSDTLLGSLRTHGYSPDDVTDVILSHLHFDHCGGAVYRDSDGELRTQFARARYWSHSAHWSWALHPNEREKASFLRENFLPIEASGQLHFLDQEDFGHVAFKFEFVYGHTEAMIVPRIAYRDHTLVFAADLMPSSYHIPMPYVMAYDIRPLDTLAEREKLLTRAVEQGDIIFFEHDPVHAMGTVTLNDKGRIVLDQTLAINDLA